MIDRYKEHANGKLMIIGISHKTAPLETRELLQLSRKEVPQALKQISADSRVKEIVLIFTCNRLEFYIVTLSGTNLFPILTDFYKSFKNIDLIDYIDNFYEHSEIDAANHLFKVISSLDSLVLGEYQIQGQIKEAYSIACDNKTVDKTMHKLFHAAFRVGKKARAGTALGEARQSVSGVASGIIIDNIPKNKQVAIIGVNENTRIVATNLSKHGFSNLVFLNRTIYKAEMMAQSIGGRAFGLDSLERVLTESSAVFTSTGAGNFLVKSETIEKLNVMERCPKIIVDMAIPRDIDFRLKNSESKYFDISSLQDYLHKQSEELLKHVPEIEKIIESELKIWEAWTEARHNAILEPYSEKFEIIRQQVIEEFKDQFVHSELEKAERMTKFLTHRLQSLFIKALMEKELNNR